MRSVLNGLHLKFKKKYGACIHLSHAMERDTQIPLIAHKHRSTRSTAAHSDKNGAINHKTQNTSHTNINMKTQLEPPNLRAY
jgi:hypothetical protein